jgi:MATE family multidrug resistance protein
MIICGVGYWLIGLPLGVLLAFPGGIAGSGIWIGLAVGLAAVAVMMTARWMMRERLGLTRHRAPVVTVIAAPAPVSTVTPVAKA